MCVHYAISLYTNTLSVSFVVQVIYLYDEFRSQNIHHHLRWSTDRAISSLSFIVQLKLNIISLKWLHHLNDFITFESMMYNDIKRCTMIYNDIQWCTMIYNDVQWCTFYNLEFDNLNSELRSSGKITYLVWLVWRTFFCLLRSLVTFFLSVACIWISDSER